MGDFMTLSKTLSQLSKAPRNSLNPYRIALGLIAKRLAWDLSPISWIHRKKLKSIKGKYEGEKAVIVCNGTSLNDVNFELLDGIFTFGLNKINLLFKKNSFRPSVIVSVNPLVIEQNSKFFSATEIPTYLDSSARGLLPYISKNVTFLHSSDFPSFSKDCSMSVYQGYTATYVTLQLAYHMGFARIALIGCDHNFLLDGLPNQVIYNQDIDQNHFSEDYFTQNQPWQMADLKGSEYAYDMARQAYEIDGRLIVNATPGSKLKVFKEVDLKSFIHD